MTKLPKIALGAWAWGNDGTFGNSLTAESLKPIFDTAMANGLNLWDTAYAYGMGTSEKVLAGFLKGLPRESYLVSDKFTPQCADTSSPTAMADMIEMQLKLMELDHFDVYWIHNVWDAPKWTEELAKYFEGKDNVPLLGVSNHNLAEIKQANEILKSHGLKLSAVQNHFSLINRSSEDSGILEYCRENGITFYAYMVLEQGALSGKYDTKHPMPEGSARAETYNPVLDKLEVLNAELKKLADKYGVGPAQIPVAWAIAKGTLPIIGVTKENQVLDAVKAANVTLTAEETAELEKVANSLELNVIRFWEKERKIMAGKILVAVFSASGVTKRVGEEIARIAGADFYEIVPKEIYTSADLDWMNKKSRSSIEMNDPSARPEINGKVADMASYDTVIVGFPIWWGVAPRIIDTFLESYEFSGKNIIPFCTSGGSGVGRSDTALHKDVSGDVKWAQGKQINRANEAEIRRWLDEVL